MLHGTIRKDDFWRNTTLQYWNNVATIRNNVATMMQRCFVLKIVVANRLVQHHQYQKGIWPHRFATVNLLHAFSYAPLTSKLQCRWMRSFHLASDSFTSLLDLFWLSGRIVSLKLNCCILMLFRKTVVTRFCNMLGGQISQTLFIRLRVTSTGCLV